MKFLTVATFVVLLGAAWLLVLLLVLALFRAAKQADEAHEKAEEEYRLRCLAGRKPLVEIGRPLEKTHTAQMGGRL